ncbi:23S rRNA (uracil-C(5))-methyltransferase RlmCD [Andreesenia angusta]|uniref:23S rRNA (Uracil-C(5))-methyltransferase RlmCD n=1 Tax=Andreesenia angusta TaxID=39480 RepID=A0A1S1VA79_9FIRM|nr:23S rRNA (uracil(1939)-C(5))-methyltransferase RlmD [Andreesenia angusta]OHW63404.1 23S rRNA (uracil-C(5))-methyltransferase RlmCD [Andreesenia angusta]
MVKKNQEVELYIDKTEFPNKGKAVCEGKTVTVKGGLEGQTVLAKVIKNRRNKVEARIIEVLEKSPLETEPKCTHFGICGGCSYQNVPYENQLALKKKQVKEIIDKADIGEYEYLDIVSSPVTEGYRNKMEYSFGDTEKDGPLALGLHQKGRFYEIEITENCNIVDSDFREVLMATLNYFREKKTPYYNKRQHAGVLRHLVVRKAINGGEMLVNLVTSSQGEINSQEFVELLTSLELKAELKGIIHTVNDSLADVVQSDETRMLYGSDIITEELLGLKFNISPFSFFQTNTKGAEVLYSKVREFIGETDDKTIFDLYCGTGTIAQILAPVAKKVYGIEIVEEAVEAAKENAVINGLENCEFIAGDVMEKVNELSDKPDIIVLDPPRDGIHPKAIHKIIDFKPETFVYVSCKPSSLERDLPVFKERGYKAEKVQCVDMFPMTPHVETVVKLYKA